MKLAGVLRISLAIGLTIAAAGPASANRIPFPEPGAGNFQLPVNGGVDQPDRNGPVLQPGAGNNEVRGRNGAEVVNRLAPADQRTAAPIVDAAVRGATGMGLRPGQYTISYNRDTQEASIILNDGASARLGVVTNTVNNGQRHTYATPRNAFQQVTARGNGGAVFNYNSASVGNNLAQGLTMNSETFAGARGGLVALGVGGHMLPDSIAADRTITVGAGPVNMYANNNQVQNRNDANPANPVMMVQNGNMQGDVRRGGIGPEAAPPARNNPPARVDGGGPRPDPVVPAGHNAGNLHGGAAPPDMRAGPPVVPVPPAGADWRPAPTLMRPDVNAVAASAPGTMVVTPRPGENQSLVTIQVPPTVPSRYAVAAGRDGNVPLQITGTNDAGATVTINVFATVQRETNGDREGAATNGALVFTIPQGFQVQRVVLDVRGSAVNPGWFAVNPAMTQATFNNGRPPELP